MGDAEERIRRLVEEALETGRTPDDVCCAAPELLAAVRDRLTRARWVKAQLDSMFVPSGDDSKHRAAELDSRIDATHIPGYVIESVLGRGGMGVAYRARRAGSGGDPAGEATAVALKLVHPHLLHLPGFRERFLQEADLGKRVVHENVLRTIDAGRVADGNGERLYLVMEYVQGQTLRALLRELGRVPEPLCRHVGREIARGLAAIHAVGAVHRDVKPENVLITREHVVKVMDLGVAKLSGAEVDLSQPGAFVGSIRYAAPEQLRRGSGLDGRADLYALGVTLYELATGSHPVTGDDFPSVAHAVLEGSPIRAGEAAPQLSPFFEELLAHLLRKDPAERPSGAVELARILEEGEESEWWRARSSALRARALGAPRRARIPGETRIHGREADLGRLDQLLRLAVAGRGQAVLVEGDAGIGKSRLVEEFTDSVGRSEAGVAVLRGAYAPGGAATPGSAFVSAFLDHFGDQNLEAALAAHLPNSAVLAPAFAAFLRGHPPPRDMQPLTQGSVLTLFVRTAQALARRRPIVIVIEDLHFAPGGAPALYASIAAALATHRILLIGTSRPPADVRWRDELERLPQVSRLVVERLENSAVSALLVDALGSSRLAERLAPAVAEWTDGNPYFVFEALRDLREEGLLVKNAAGNWSAPDASRLPRVVPSIRRRVERRIAALPPEEREVLQVAACCGLEFDPLLVGVALRVERLPLFKMLSHLECAHRLVHASGRRHVFDHHHVQEAVVAGLSDAHREAVHFAVAEALERSSGTAHQDPCEIDGPSCIQLATHFFRGAAGDRALRYLEPAVSHLMDRYEYEQAIELCRSALAIDGLLRGAARGRVLSSSARCAAPLGRPAEQLAYLQEGVALADAADDKTSRARARHELGSCLARLGRNDEAESTLNEAVSMFREVGNVSSELEAIGQLSFVYLLTGRFDLATEVNSRCVERAMTTGDLNAEKTARRGLGNSVSALGRFDEAQVHQERALALCRQLGDRPNEAAALHSLGVLFAFMGRLDDALQHLGASKEIVERVGDREGEARAARYTGLFLHQIGRHDEAATLLQKSRDLAQELDTQGADAITAMFMGSGLLMQERHEEALSVFEEALALTQRIRFRFGEALALACLGALHAERGRVEQAIDVLDRALAMGRDLGIPEALLTSEAERARLPGGSIEGAKQAMASYGPRVELGARMHAHWLLWLASHDRSHLAEARRILDQFVEHAPPESRETMRTKVALHRDILAATSV